MAGAEQNEDSFTFSGARSLARSFESGLVRMGAQAADVVAIVLPNMPQYALAFMGAAEAGFVITTLNHTYTSGDISCFLFKLLRTSKSNERRSTLPFISVFVVSNVSAFLFMAALIT